MPRGQKPSLTPEQDRDIAARYRDGQSVPQIARAFGVSTHPIFLSLDRSGIARRKLSEYGWQATPENRAELVRLWREGLSVQKIGRHLHIKNDTVSRILTEEGIPARRGGANRVFKDSEATALAAEHASGVSMSELARRYQCSLPTIRNTLNRAGAQIHRYGHEPRFWTPERTQWLREQHEAGRSDSSIARELGYSQTAISRTLRRLGIAGPRTQGEGPGHHSWQGGRIIDSSGYVRVLTPEGYVSEHRVVMARILGRALLPTETVHHINGDKQDNSPENLQLRQGNHGNGIVLHCLDCGSHNVEAVPLT